MAKIEHCKYCHCLLTELEAQGTKVCLKCYLKRAAK